MSASKIHKDVVQGSSFHLFWARLLLVHILLDNAENVYSNDDVLVLFGPYQNKNNYVSIANCSSFVNELLKFSYNLSDDAFTSLMGISQPFAVDYYDLIDQNHHFIKITNIHQVQSGDFMAINYPPGSTDEPSPEDPDTGHIMIINGPVQSVSRPPVINHTLQWQIPIIDQSAHRHPSPIETRPRGQHGLGASYVRLYSDITGNITGYSWSPYSKAHYYSTEERPIAIGRFKPHHI